MISRTKLQQRKGWSGKLIERLMIVPLEKSGSRFYPLHAVLAVEKSPAFRRLLSLGVITRHNENTAQVKRIISELLDVLSVHDVAVRKVEGVKNLAIKHYLERSDTFWPGMFKSIPFLERITVNYIKHELSNYEEVLPLVYVPGGKKRYLLINRAYYSEIAHVYPKYISECERQYAMKENDTLAAHP